MRLLTPEKRIRVMNAVRHILSNSTHSQFKFEKEYARVIAGEEEAIYAWAAANFAMGHLLESSEGSGTVMNPRLTYGALEMGGASSQIAFYQDDMNIMSNLFKLQIGQGKHWNVYCHSHLSFGINQAWERMGAFLATSNDSNNIPTLVYNPCLAVGSYVRFETSMYYNKTDGSTHWRVDSDGNPFPYTTTMLNSNQAGNYEACADIVCTILNKQDNKWCNFSHHGSCSFAGVYQPPLPDQSESFGEFLAFSNYYQIFEFLKIPLRSSVAMVEDGARKICAMSVDELKVWNNGTIDDEEASKMCFQAVST